MNTLTSPVVSTSKNWMNGPLAATVLALLIVVGNVPAAVAEVAAVPIWQPESSERLVRLPPQFIKKSLDRDFVESQLGKALSGVTNEVRLKAQTLSDLQSAIEQSQGEVKTELQHQFLAEKKEYLELMTAAHNFQRRQLAVKRRVYSQLLDLLQREDAAMTPARADLVERQEDARQRFVRSTAAVDLQLFETTTVQETRYSREYSRNFAAMEALAQAIEVHPMNESSVVYGLDVTKSEYLRQMIAEADAEAAIIDQADQVIGLMAKLVALDATAMAENISSEIEYAEIDAGDAAASGVVSAVSFFVSN
jgi:hypothetical protein